MQKVVLITGASSGIGHATANKFIAGGHRVYGFARRTNLMKDLEELGGYMMFGDVTNDKSVKKIVGKVIKNEGRIDILVNNAGYAQYGSLEDVTINQAKNQFETNVFGYARTIKEVLPQMRKQKSGTIINVTSSAGKINGPLVTWYGASKFALEGLLDAVRNEASLFNVKIVMVEPGFIDTGLYRVAWGFLDKVKTTDIYKKMLSAFVKDFKRRQKKAPGGEIIANKIYEISLSNNPKTRYALPGDAKFFLFMRKILSDKTFDTLILKSLGIK